MIVNSLFADDEAIKLMARAIKHRVGDKRALISIIDYIPKCDRYCVTVAITPVQVSSGVSMYMSREQMIRTAKRWLAEKPLMQYRHRRRLII